MRKTKIVATVGPASNSLEKIKELLNAGVNAVRINFSHGSHESHAETVEKVKKIREELKLPIPLILDTKGPEIRTKTLKTETVELKKGNSFILTTDECEGDETKVSLTYPDIIKDLKIGSKVLIDDGLIELCVKDIKGRDIICEVENSGVLGERKGVNIPDAHIGLPALSEKDIDDIKFGIKAGFDYIAASFIRSADDVREIRKLLKENGGSSVRIISKIENREGVDNLNEILTVTDGIMVARGDLGVEIPLEEVPVIQKNMIRKCKEYGKFVITATQMLESMINNPRPTRAEASDVANAIFDGTDAIMLSGETAKGSYPAEAVKTMEKIAKKIESAIDYSEEFSRYKSFTTDNITDAVAHATCTTAADLNAACIIAVSKSGFTVTQIAKFRPTCGIYAFTPDEQVCRQLNILWGCRPGKLIDITTSAFDLFNAAAFEAFKMGKLNVGDIAVIVGGTPIGVAGNTNTLKVHYY